MSAAVETFSSPFIDRRAGEPGSRELVRERRQFTGNYDDLSPDGRDLGRAIDEYKMIHRRRFINYDEMVAIIKSLGYAKAEA